MIVIIDTTQKECQVGLADIDNIQNIDSIKWLWQKDTGSELLKNLQVLLKKGKKNLQDIKGVIVNQGPGSYTGTRVGIVIANTLGWSLNVPVIGYRGGKLEKVLSRDMRKITKANFLKPVLPYYE